MAGKSSMVKKKAKNLLDGSDSEDDTTLKINEDYAGRYEKWRGKEELQKFTDRYGEAALKNLNDSDNGESTSTDEDEDAREMTADVEKQFFKTLACLKKKDPKIYDAGTSFFKKKEPTEDVANKVKEKKEKPMFLRDYERKVLLEKDGHITSSDEEIEEEDPRAHSPTFVQEQQEIRQSFKSALKDESDDEEKEVGLGGLFKQKEKSKEDQAKEEEDYRQWLKGQKDQLEDKQEESELGALKSYWSDPKLEEGEVFLRDYILNKRYLESDDFGKKKSFKLIANDLDESGDEEIDEKMEQFEHKYNFRFEEPDQEFVKRYPRTMTGSLRQKDDRRKQHREDVKERKEKEKEQKRQELKQLKAIKRKELEERLLKLKEVTGNADIPFEDIDLDEDFDPAKHDQKMQNMFDEEFYDAGGEEEEKPEFPDLDKELEIENWDEYGGDDAGEGPSNSGPHCEDPDFNMDCDFDPRNKNFQKEMLESQSGRKKKKKRSKLAEILEKKKPRFNRESQEVDKYMDEYYGLDYEDIIGDLPCRFKYREVVPNSFGLTVEEILMADDKELNRWCSLKKTCMYRNEDLELYDLQAYNKKGNIEALKRKYLPSLFKHEEAEPEGEASAEQKPKKKKKKKNKDKKKGRDGNIPSTTESAPEPSPKKIKTEVTKSEPDPSSPVVSPKKIKTEVIKSEPEPDHEPKKKSKRKREEEKLPQKNQPSKKKFKSKNSATKSKPDNSFSDMSDARLKAFGINPKKFKNKIKYGNNE